MPHFVDSIPGAVRPTTAQKTGCRHAGIIFGLIWCIAGCTDVALYRLTAVPQAEPPPAPDSTAIMVGTYCASNPEHLVYPVKVLIILDDSGSMANSDPGFQRLTAARQLGDDLLVQEGYFVGIERFQGGEPELLTQDPVFTDDLDTIHAVLEDSLHQPGRGTPIKSALALASTTIQQDITEDPAMAARTRYVVLLLSDGEPSDDNPPYSMIKEHARTLKHLTGAGEITLHTAYVQDGQLNTDAQTLLMELAQIGEGEFKSFPNGDSIDFSDFDVGSLAIPYIAIAPLLVTNINARLGRDGVEADSDGDGLTDVVELEIGTDPTEKDTDDDGCTDLLENRDFLSNPRDPSDCGCRNRELANVDQDQDLLNACMEELMGTDDLDPDCDFDNAGNDLSPDNMLDVLEVTWGLIPRLDDARRNYDSDAVDNLEELKAHTDPLRTESAEIREMYSYQYEVSALPNKPCYDFSVSNIVLADTMATEDHEARENLILLYFIEAPKPDPAAERIFRLMHKTVRFYPNAIGPQVVQITAEDFVRLESVL